MRQRHDWRASQKPPWVSFAYLSIITVVMPDTSGLLLMSAPTNRPRCPFYGFRWPERSRSLSDTGDNECALDFERNGPCIMEAQGKEPDLDACPVPVPIRPLLDASRKTIIIHPAEFAPEGVSLEDWTRQVMVRVRPAW
jgi:hypothetical protein